MPDPSVSTDQAMVSEELECCEHPDSRAESSAPFLSWMSAFWTFLKLQPRPVRSCKPHPIQGVDKPTGGHCAGETRGSRMGWGEAGRKEVEVMHFKSRQGSTNSERQTESPRCLIIIAARRRSSICQLPVSASGRSAGDGVT